MHVTNQLSFCRKCLCETISKNAPDLIRAKFENINIGPREWNTEQPRATSKLMKINKHQRLHLQLNAGKQKPYVSNLQLFSTRILAILMW